jgi:hypothetical protein
MTLIVCLDQNDGILFNNRRQTLDFELLKIVEKSFSDIHISDFSQKYFSNIRCTVSENPFLSAVDNSAVFHECGEALPYLDKIDKIVIYRWAKVYPADTYFDICPTESGFKLSGKIKFSTEVHKDIIKEIYKR